MGSDAEPFVAGNKFVTIEEIQKDYPDFAADHDIKSIAASATASDGNHYFVPGPGYSEALFANKKVLAEAGVTLPDEKTTYEAWVADLKKIKDAKFIPLATVFAPAEGIHYLWEYTSYNNEKVAKDHGTYDAKDAAKVAAYAAGLDDIKALYDDGLLYPSADSATNGDAFAALVADKAAFFVGGSWSYNVEGDAAKNIAITYFPSKGNDRKNTDAIGGISMGFAISRKAYEDPSKRDGVVNFVNTVTNAESLLSYGEWRSYTLSAAAADSKTRAYVPNEAWDAAERVSEGGKATALTDTLKSALVFNAGVTLFAGAVQDNIPAANKTILFGQSAEFFKGKGTAAALLEAVIAA
jgi:raffinose/stachyose/melibiose transport system substrate-binding protein